MKVPSSPIVLVGNYPPDNQFSMLKYSRMLERHILKSGGQAIHVAPSRIFGRLNNGNKWLGYLDKFLLFPRRLKKELSSIESKSHTSPILHICDHSNSLYLHAADKCPTVLTCHDLMAIRMALGEFTGELTRRSGKILQKHILKSIPQASRIACVSASTEQDLLRVLPETQGRTCVVHNGFNALFNRLSVKETEKRLAKFKLGEQQRIILHVGSNAWYKNRLGVLKIFQDLLQSGDCPDVHLVMVGPGLDGPLEAFIQRHGLESKILCTGPIGDSLLEAFYSKAEAFIFPSRHEGFGWPPVEAQSCGCPVVASNNGSLWEILGDSAMTAAWDDTEKHVENLRRILTEGSFRKILVNKGIENIKRFSAEKMTETFFGIYCDLEEAHSPKVA